MDGWLVKGVVTTRIYCRPSCPARPKQENVRVFEGVGAARAAGMRACKRCAPDDAAPEGAVVRHLPFTPPLDLDALLGFFGRRAVPGVEEWDGEVFRRSLRLPRGPAVAEIRSLGDRVGVRMWLDDLRDERAALACIHGMLDLDADVDSVDAALGGDSLLAPLVAASPGRRVPGCADGDELAARAVLGQQVSLAGAATLAGRLVAEHGERLAQPVGAVTHVFPTAAAIAAADDGSWPMPASRRRALVALSAALANGELRLEPGAEGRATEDQLLSLPGIGPWTASYVGMRALRDRDAFLASDLGVRHALERLGADARPRSADQLSQRWRPYRAYALQHLWAVAA